MLCNFEQLEKALSPIDVQFDKSIFTKLEQLENVELLIVVSKEVLPTDVKLLQPENAYSPRLVQLLRSTDFKEEQL